MSTGSGLLAVWMQVAPFLEDDLNAWYEKEHIAERLGIPGFLSARRYVSEQAERRYIALYELSSPAVMQSEPYLAAGTNPTPWTDRIGEALIENVRNEYELVQSVGEEPDTPAPFALVVRIETEAADDGELNAWYERDHLGALQSVPGCFRARRFRATIGAPKYLAVYDLASAEVPSGEAWKKAADSDWTIRMRPKFKNLTVDLGQLLVAKA
jgi:hypothetical protein